MGYGTRYIFDVLDVGRCVLYVPMPPQTIPGDAQCSGDTVTWDITAELDATSHGQR